MADKDSSVVISLEQLMTLEQRRIQEEEEGRRRAAETARAEALAAAERARDEEARRARDAEGRRAAALSRSREEQARIDAIRQAELERARATAEHEARLTAALRMDEHERRMRTIRDDRQGRHLRLGVVVSASLTLLLFAGTLGFYYGKIKPESEELARSQERHLAEQQDDLRRSQADAERKQKELDSLAREVEQARVDAGLDAAPARSADHVVPKNNGHNLPPDRVPKKTGGPCPCSDPFDPMCGFCQ